jgi:uracil-DNA glycosylase
MDAESLREYLGYYRDLGFKTVYKRPAPPAVAAQTETAPETAAVEIPEIIAAVPSQKRASRPDSIIPPATPAVPEGDTFERIRGDIGECRRCRLHEGRGKIVFGSGNEGSRLVFVGEGPGADEDAQGLPFVGRAGQLLTQMIEGTASREGIPIKRPDVYICNVVKCRPPGNRTPQPDEMEICGQFLTRQLLAMRPAVICALGSTAAKYLLPDEREGITRLRGNWYKWNGIPVMPTYHPSYLLRAYNVQPKREAWEDLKKVLHFVYD